MKYTFTFTYLLTCYQFVWFVGQRTVERSR